MVQPVENYSFDLVVIGAGPAGEKGAVTAASLGKRVALIEQDPQVGGAAVNTGTLPSKTLRETALALSGLRARELYGVDLSLRRAATVAEFMYHERHVTANERDRVLYNLFHHHVTLYRGRAQFVDPHTVCVVPDEAGGGPGREASSAVHLRGEKLLIATGSAPVRPPEFPFAHPRINDSDEILQLEHLPTTLAVVGAGVIGSEYACTFAALGAQVHLIDGREGLLPFLDREVSQALTAAMERLGIVFHWQERVTACAAPADGPVVLTLSSGAHLSTEAVLVAAGRSSNTAALNLSAAGIPLGPRGLLAVDAQFRTAVPHIYAAGDVIGFPALASTSTEQARVAICHAFDPNAQSVGAPLLPNGIYTIPEVSMVGETEETLRDQGVEYVVGRALYIQNPRGEIIGDISGFLKLLFRRTDMQLLGVHVIGEQASELVHLGLLALLTKSGAELFINSCFNYPSLGDLYKTAATAALTKRGT